MGDPSSSPWMSRKSTFLIALTLVALIGIVQSEDFYELLGIERDADAKDIRRAFKRLALTMHPDKNQDDPKAHDKFVRINRAYEVLKDDDLRKKYDRFGEEGLKEQNQRYNKYESWQFYKTEFGLYDEDPEIVTLSKSDFEQSVFGEDIWIVNFYSPRCHHCHDLAPAWREFAKEVEGVIRVGAVNCWDDRPLCTAQNVKRFPTLFVYPKHEEYTGTRSLEPLVKFALNLVDVTIHPLWIGNFKKVLLADEAKNHPWLISYCGSPVGTEDEDTHDMASVGCLDRDDQLKLAAILNKVVSVGSVDCSASSQLCTKLKIEESTIRFYNKAKEVTKGGKELELEQPKQMADEILKQLPDLSSFTSAELQEARQALEVGGEAPPVVTYFMKKAGDDDLELKKLPHLLTDMKVRKFNCSTDQALCDDLYLGTHLPKVALFRKGGGHEFHHGRLFAQDIAAFARHGLTSRLRVLGPKDFPDPVINSGELWFVDFFSPHCPPCKQLLPEVRKAASRVPYVNFGTVDCTTHQALCSQQNIRSYPTTVFFNDSKPHVSVGFSNSHAIQEFIEDTLNPKVITLSQDLFDSLVKNRAKGDLWLVDFYAPWCGPCQALMPEWRKFAKKLNGTAHVGSVDCVEHSSLCVQLGVNSYPTIRAYPMGRTGAGGFSAYQGWNRDVMALMGWVQNFLPTSVEIITQGNFRDLVLRSTDPWVVDFYAPWCGPCMAYMPSLEEVAKALKGYVRVGKINCQSYQSTCGQASIQSYPSLRIYKGTETKGYSQNWFGEQVYQKEPQYLIPYLKQKFTKNLESTGQIKDEL
ncbi:dnaJ homolog subfamily C member 10 [Strongylocentrotus purpuratus]|uniref:DnaJ homolog subfamily C member 10 n=1 Tax=Strongylocentrotus purpuratus TaxID=7668 RepID=A0A7M7N7R9_STRPU|nr:dnaJ homolog subfamily C member 10 [Strongylocentrotus purpuratus]